MNYDISKFINNIAKMSGEHLILKPVSRPSARYVGISPNALPADPGKTEEAVKAPAENPAGSAEAENPNRMRKSRPVAPSVSTAPAPSVEPAEENVVLRFDMTKQDLLTGFIMSEVLGRPKCFSMRRRPGGR